MHLVGACLGTAVADDGPHRDQRRLVLHRLRGLNGFRNPIEVVAVSHALHVPVISLETLQHILSEGQLRRAVE